MAAGQAELNLHNTPSIEQWNGTTWSIDSVPNPSAAQSSSILGGVSCVNTAFCMAVGIEGTSGADQTLVEEWNGAAWSVIPSANANDTDDNDLSAVSCVSAVFCVASGEASATAVLNEQWNGTTWSIMPSPSPAIDVGIVGLSCLSTSFCVGVGDSYNGTIDQTYVEQWNGTRWSVVPSPDPVATNNYDLDSVSCTSTNMCVAVGESFLGSTPSSDLAEQWNGSTWSAMPVPAATTSFGDFLSTVDCFGPTSCVAGGGTDTDGSHDHYLSQALTWSGSTWAGVSIPDPPSPTQSDDIEGLSCVRQAFCVGVGGATTGGSTVANYAVSSPITRPGYNEVASDGGIFTFGGASFFGSTGAIHLNKPIVGMAVTPDGGGYWLVASDGGIFAFGDAGFFGSTGALTLNKPIVGMASTPDGLGYWLVASDGGIFGFGDAGFFGSQGATPLNKPIVGMASTPDGLGYWLVASDGGIFTHGDAAFLGSQGATPLNKPIVGMAATPDGGGYWLVASDGGIFTHGDAGFFGSQGATALNKPIVGMAATSNGLGYWLVASDGGIFTHGDAGFFGSEGGTMLNKPVVGMGA